MTRPDVKQKCLGDFLNWSLTIMSQTSGYSVREVMVLDGALQSLVNVYTCSETCTPERLCTCSVWLDLQRVIYKSRHDWHVLHNTQCGFSRCVMHLLLVWDLLLQVTWDSLIHCFRLNGFSVVESSAEGNGILINYFFSTCYFAQHITAVIY